MRFKMPPRVADAEVDWLGPRPLTNPGAPAA
jgi:hypothetical protein